MTLPPIREWWPELSVAARVDVLEHAPHVGDLAREEIRSLTGAVVGMQETLSQTDLDYARADAEAQVDEESAEG
ncbi:hypothetical protein [Microbacterium sp. H83]|uniref:hypothetical protein n=1 Tax=Microbacterium sp. H83 TaxID=1827324 RepID=UPI0007F495E1|nr:hypothetical protein [Microbacterium sp. H83]OAN33628.1 hypothetical protein A4X16_06455 [Microbacterium sp. H83]